MKIDGTTILIVEDEVLIRMALADYLRGRGFHVIETGTAEAAQDVIRSANGVDAVISDVDLGPGMSGLTLAEWVRANYRRVPVLLATGVLDAVEHVTEHAVLQKPYTMRTLQNCLEKLLERPLQRVPPLT